MRFIQHHSSSGGNLYELVASNGKRLLLECGVPWKKMQKALGYDLSGIVGCLVTHEHKDHCKAIHEVMAAGIDCYMSPGTARAIFDGEPHRRAKIFGYRDKLYSVGMGAFYFRGYEAHHDAEDPVYYLVNTTEECIIFAPDTSHITQRFKTAFNIIAIECSYDQAILHARVDAGTINESLAKRLLTSHMEKAVTMKYLADFCDLSHCREIHLLHMSSDNIDKESTRKEFQERFCIDTFIVGERQGCPNTTA